MARTKQSARKSTGGKAPKKQLATKAARKFVCYLTSQQNSGQINEKGEEKKTIFINCENTFRQFQFQRFQLINEVFQPIISLGRVNNLINNKQSNLYMRFDIASCLDGMGIFNIGRPSIDLCFVIDVSGSMGSQFPSDSDRRPKLSVAKSCLQSILPKLTESDRISIIQFDDRQELLLPLSHVSNSTIEKIEEILTELTPRGGTSLGSGIAAGFKHLLDADSIIPPDSLITDIRQKRTKRVIFMTDMESTPQDETDVIKFSQEAVQGIVPVPQIRVNSMFAPSTNKSITPTTSSTSNQVQQSNNISSNSVFTSIIGIGVDLSVNTIERISAIPGARYISAVTAQEFMSVVAEEFPYDITPIGFDIKITLPPQYTINRIYGASELNSITDGSSNFTISSEFANPLNSIQNTNTSEVEYGTDGGILLIRLNEVSNNSKKVSFNDNPNNNSTVFSPRRSTRNKSLSSPSPNTNNNDSDENETKLSTIPLQDNFVRVEWTDIQNYKHHCDLALPIIQPLNEDEKTSENCDIGLRKAVALMTYVDCLERYGTKPELPFYLNNGIANQIQDITNLSFLEICSMKSLQTLPYYNFIPEHFIKTHEIIQQFQQLKGFLVQSLLECSDDTIFSSNQNILQTVNQVIDLEILELKSDYKEIEDQVALIRLNEKNNEKQEHANLDDKNCPYSYLCPISLTIMKNPVIASDGHSYERESIEEWLKTKNTSPVTNLPLPNQYLIDNHTLRSAIEEYLSKKNENKNNEDDDDDDDDSNGGTTLTKNITPSKRGRSNTSRGRSVKRGR